MGKWLYPEGFNVNDARGVKPAASQTHPFEHVEAYLKGVNKLIRGNDFVVLDGDPDDPSDTRSKKNGDFMRMYNLTSRSAQRRLLLTIVPEDYCHTIATNDGRSLYVFCIKRELQRPLCDPESIAIYVKHDCNPGVSNIDVVISLHPIEHPIFLPHQD